MECEICKKGPFEGVSVFRTGPTGAPTTEWRCEEHLPSYKRNEEEIRLVSVLEGS